MSGRRILGTLVIVAVAVALPVGASAMQEGRPAIFVTSLADTVALDGKCTLREAIQNHNAMSIPNADCKRGHAENLIKFPIAGTIFLTSELPVVQGTMKIEADDRITLDGSSQYRIIESTGRTHLILAEVTLTHGNASGDGGAVFMPDGRLELHHATLSYNTASGNGGAVYATGGRTSMFHSTFDHNTAVDGGGMAGQDITMLDTSFTNNHASEFGGGLQGFGLTMTDSTVSNNSAGTGFGGVLAGGNGVISHTLIEDNTAQQFAGIGIQEADGTQFTLHEDTIRNNNGQCNGAGLATAFY